MVRSPAKILTKLWTVHLPRMTPFGLKHWENAFQTIPDISLFDAQNMDLFVKFWPFLTKWQLDQTNYVFLIKWPFDQTNNLCRFDQMAIGSIYKYIYIYVYIMHCWSNDHLIENIMNFWSNGHLIKQIAIWSTNCNLNKKHNLCIFDQMAIWSTNCNLNKKHNLCIFDQMAIWSKHNLCIFDQMAILSNKSCILDQMAIYAFLIEWQFDQQKT